MIQYLAFSRIQMILAFSFIFILKYLISFYFCIIFLLSFPPQTFALIKQHFIRQRSQFSTLDTRKIYNTETKKRIWPNGGTGVRERERKWARDKTDKVAENWRHESTIFGFFIGVNAHKYRASRYTLYTIHCMHI